MALLAAVVLLATSGLQASAEPSAWVLVKRGTFGGRPATIWLDVAFMFGTYSDATAPVQFRPTSIKTISKFTVLLQVNCTAGTAEPIDETALDAKGRKIAGYWVTYTNDPVIRRAICSRLPADLPEIPETPVGPWEPFGNFSSNSEALVCTWADGHPVAIGVLRNDTSRTWNVSVTVVFTASGVRIGDANDYLVGVLPGEQVEFRAIAYSLDRTYDTCRVNYISWRPS